MTQGMDMQHALEPTEDAGWLLVAQDYNTLRESSIESRFAVSNGLLGVRAARALSRGPTWVSWLNTLRWASWPRTYVAGLFDTPNTEPAVPALVPVGDWLRLRVLVNGRPLLQRSGETLVAPAYPGPAAGRAAHRVAAARSRRRRRVRADPPPGVAGRPRSRPAAGSPGGRAGQRGHHGRGAIRCGRRGTRTDASRAGSRGLAHRAVGQAPGDRLHRFAAIGRCRSTDAGARSVPMVVELDIGARSGRIVPAPDRGRAPRRCRR